MSNKFNNIDAILSVLCQIQRYPDGTPYKWNATEREDKARALYSKLADRFRGISLSFDDQDRSDYARISLPATCQRDPSPYACIILSQIESFATVAYAPSLLPEVSDIIQNVLIEEQWGFVPFSIFCPRPPEGNTMADWNGWIPENEDIWRRLFDYL